MPLESGLLGRYSDWSLAQRPWQWGLTLCIFCLQRETWPGCPQLHGYHCALLGCYAAGSSNSVPTFRDKRCHVGAIAKVPLKMAPTGCPETSVRNYYYTLRNSSEERSSHLLHGESLKLRMVPGCLPRGRESKENGAVRQTGDG